MLGEQSMDQLGRALISSGLDAKLIELFPPNKRDEECFARHFEVEDMKPLVEFHQRNQRNSHKDELLAHTKEMLEGEASPQEVRLGSFVHRYSLRIRNVLIDIDLY
jgi:hypothetical protein